MSTEKYFAEKKRLGLFFSPEEETELGHLNPSDYLKHYVDRLDKYRTLRDRLVAISKERFEFDVSTDAFTLALALRPFGELKAKAQLEALLGEFSFLEKDRDQLFKVIGEGS